MFSLYYTNSVLFLFFFTVSLPRGAFSGLESLFKLDLSHNGMSHMEDGALIGMENLLYLSIAHNDLSRFNSDVFKGKYL